jgi:hypothetical protein
MSRLRILTAEQHQGLIGQIDEMIRDTVGAKDRRIAALAQLRVEVDTYAKSTRELPLRLADFLEAVNILRSLDLPDLQAAGLFTDTTKQNRDKTISRWGAFRDDPIGFLIRADERIRSIIWTLVERRMHPTIAVSEAHRINEHAAP